MTDGRTRERSTRARRRDGLYYIHLHDAGSWWLREGVRGDQQFELGARKENALGITDDIWAEEETRPEALGRGGGGGGRRKDSLTGLHVFYTVHSLWRQCSSAWHLCILLVCVCIVTATGLVGGRQANKANEANNLPL